MPANATIGGSANFRPAPDPDTGNQDALALASAEDFTAVTDSVAQVRIDADDLIATTTQEARIDLMGGTFTVDAGTNRILTVPNHGLFAGDLIRLSSTGALPGGLLASITYCVIAVDADEIQVAVAKGGSAFDITAAAGSGTHYWQYYGVLNLSYTGPTSGPAVAVKVLSNRAGESNDFTNIKGIMVQLLPTHPGDYVRGTFTVDAGTNVITTSATHLKAAGQRIRFSTTDTLPAPLEPDTDYYVLTAPGATTMTVSATSGGAVVDITTAGTGTHSWKTMGDADGKAVLTIGNSADPGNFISVPLELYFRPDAEPPEITKPFWCGSLPQGIDYSPSYHLKVQITKDIGNQNLSVLILILGR